MKQYQNKKVFSQEKADETKNNHSQDEHATNAQTHYQAERQSINEPTNGPTNKSEQYKDDEEITAKTKQAFTRSIQFDEVENFTPIDINQEETQVESGLVDVIRPTFKRMAGVSFVLASFLGLLAWQCVDNITIAYQQGDWLSLGWSGLVASIASVGGWSLVKEWRKLKRLRYQTEVQKQGEDLIASHGIGKGEAFCESLAKHSNITLENVGYDRWRKVITVNHNDADIIELYDAMVVSIQDKKAQQLVAEYSAQAAVLVAVSPLALADMLLVAWRNITLINKLAKIYGIELGYWSRIKLLKLVFINMAAAGASELVIDASMHMISMDIAGKVSSRTAQGIGVGLLTARLGIRTMALLRPLPWKKDKMVKLGDIRKQIVAKVLKLDKS